MKIAFLAPISREDIYKLRDTKNAEIEQYQSFLIPLILNGVREQKGILVTVSTEVDADECWISGNLTTYIVKVSRHGNLRALLKFEPEIRAMARILEKEQCDILHAHWCYEFAIAALRVNKNRTLVTIHDWPFEIMKYYTNFFWRRWIELGVLCLKEARYFSAVSPYIQNELTDYNPSAVCKMIPNYMNALYSGEFQKSVNEAHPCIVCINNGFNELKNTQVAMRAFQVMRKRIPEAELYMYGNGYEADGEAFKWAKREKLQENIFFEGHQGQDTIINKLREAMILLHTSREESFGLVFIEAMQSKCVVIAGEHSGAAPWVLAGGEAGILCDIDDAQQIAEKLNDLIRNQTLREMYINKATEYVEKMFGFQQIARQYSKYYEKIEKASEDVYHD